MMLRKLMHRSMWPIKPCTKFEGDGDGGDGGGGGEAPSLALDLGGLTDHKGDDGLNFFDDTHLESLKVWGSDDPTKAKFRDADGKVSGPKVVKAYLDLQRQQGKLNKPLADDASERERSDYRKALGKMLNVPDTADGYEVLVDKVPEGVVLPEAILNKLKIYDHKHNVSPEGFQSHVDLLTETIVGQKAEATEFLTTQNSETETKVKAELGPEDYAESSQLLERLVKKYTADDAESDEFFTGFKSTLFAGGSKTKVVLAKILAAAAQAMEGTSSVIQSETQDKVDDRSLGKKEFPNSPEMH